MLEPYQGCPVLAVDDDADAREHLSEILSAAGYRVVTAENGLEAMVFLHAQLAEGDLPCVILLDLVMPVSGWEFREEQSKVPELAEIPVVVISGQYHAVSAAQSLNAATALQKPIDVGLLLSVVKSFCGAVPK